MAVGFHIIADFYGVDKHILDSKDEIEKIFDKACEIAKFNVLSKGFKKFEPYGLSALYYLSESHLSVHTWPEHGLATVDIYTCSTKKACLNAYDVLKIEFKPKTIDEVILERGKKIDKI